MEKALKHELMRWDGRLSAIVRDPDPSRRDKRVFDIQFARRHYDQPKHHDTALL